MDLAFADGEVDTSKDFDIVRTDVEIPQFE
jgi:hypothetical protein